MIELDSVPVLGYFLWTSAIIAVGVCVVLAIVSARINLPVLGALAAIPVPVGLLLIALGLEFWPPHAIFGSILAVELFVLGVVAGGPLTLYIVGRAESHSVQAGRYGGIVPSDTASDRGVRDGIGRDLLGDNGSDDPDGALEGREVLRGGATIGYLERIAVLGCLAVGRVEGIAVIVAIKGLGRFSELDSPEARERFIIGTLVSLIWACAAGALLMLTLQSRVAF
jgi:hypothetical protein